MRDPAPATGDRPPAPYLPWLAVMAVAYALTHHIGFGLAWLGNAGETRWADWADLLTPYAVLLPAAAALRAGEAAPRLWILYLAGALTYVEGHGVHLAANSVSNAEPSDLVHLWDEVVGHYLWYGGLTVVLIALAAALARRPPVRGPLPAFLALSTGVTFTTNALEGGTAIAAIIVTAAFTAWGWHTRDHLGRLLIYAFAPALLLLTAYGIMQGGFPEPSDIGWV
ncbi:hypothetical protein ACGFNU_20115 [Spirillospora sp. NPDC048911]|uniref:hypothetical protein n=1 Tax=Spirillospora sp. NPDC048911 TaxID=3364527 RepID=UPI00371C7ADE